MPLASCELPGVEKEVGGKGCIDSETIMRYLANCFLLTIPALAFNIVFIKNLPKTFSREVFWKDIPRGIAYGENIFRVVVFFFPLFMPLTLSTPLQQAGMFMYVIGTLIYFLSWVLLMHKPQSTWSLSPIGFLAPAYTPLLWLLGIALIGNSLYFTSVPYEWWYYFAGVVLFLTFHLSHAWIVYARTFPSGKL